MYERLKNGQVGKNGIALSETSSQDMGLASIKNGNDLKGCQHFIFFGPHAT
jgi:hypothetical protein